MTIEDPLITYTRNKFAKPSADKVFIPEWGPPEKPGPIETGWLIENERTHAWLFVPEWSTFGWTNDPLKPIRFARREDAEQVMRMIESVDCKATEHQWG